MQELIKYIGDILNIKTESVYTVQDMTEELSKIKDIVAYRSYIKDNLASIEVDYKTGFQKFLILTGSYLDLEFEAQCKKDFVGLIDYASDLCVIEAREEGIDKVVLKKEFRNDPIVKILTDAIGENATIECIRGGAFKTQYIIGRGEHRYTHFGTFVTKQKNKKVQELPYNKLDERLTEMTKRIKNEL